MTQTNFDTLSQATNGLNEQGFTATFSAEESALKVRKLEKSYQPQELKIVQKHRFEGMSNPGDTTVVLAIKAEDGTKGTLVMSLSAKHSQNVDLIRQIPEV